uniref:Vps54_N domain-containing protein n=1 Tax=Heterorhabditis bacteriophora TaxID=37862 RepID=A0A1I7XMW3_HETBA
MTTRLPSRLVTYVYKHGSNNMSIDIPIPIPEYTDVDEYIAKLMGSGCFEFFNEDELRKSLTEFINEEQEKIEDEFDDQIIRNALIENQIDLSARTDCCQMSYNFSLESEPEAELFADRFSYVMRTSPSSELAVLMTRKLEINKEMYSLIRARNWEVDQLTMECEAILRSSANANMHPHKLSKVNEKLRNVHNSYACQIEALCEKHRKDYRNLVDILYEGGTIMNTGKRGVEIEEASEAWMNNPRLDYI